MENLTEKVFARVSQADKLAIEVFAKQLEVSPAWVVRKAIREFLERTRRNEQGKSRARDV